MSLQAARDRYRAYRRHTKELAEEEALPICRTRILFVSVDEDVLRRLRREWYDCPQRRVDWDWEQDIIGPLHRAGPRYLDFAMIVGGQICGLVAARVSRRKRWISLTHVEACPEGHPLKGRILPLAINTLYIFRGVICPPEATKSLGIRVLNPTPEALSCYNNNGYRLSSDSKWLRDIIIEPSGTDIDEKDHGRQTQLSSFAPPAEDATDSGGRA